MSFLGEDEDNEDLEGFNATKGETTVNIILTKYERRKVGGGFIGDERLNKSWTSPQDAESSGVEGPLYWFYSHISENKAWQQPKNFDQYSSPTLHDFLIVLFSIMLVVGCIGNLLVIGLFLRSRLLRSSGNYLVINLAVSDLLILATNLPALIYNSANRGLEIGIYGCQAYGFIGSLCGTNSIITLAAIALDRYYVIINPLATFKRGSGLKKRMLCIIFGILAYSSIFAILPLVGVNSYVPEGIGTSCSFDFLSSDMKTRVYIFVFFVAAWLLPLCVIIFCYLKIYFCVVNDSLEFVPGTSAKSRKQDLPLCCRIRPSEKKRAMELKIAKTGITAVAIWTVAWTPYALMALIGIFFGPNKYLTPLVSLIPSILCKTASCINPYVYALKHPKFQRELKKSCKFFLRSMSGSDPSRMMESTSYTPAVIFQSKMTIHRQFVLYKGDVERIPY